jgi:di/tricarboxylate transporter
MPWEAWVTLAVVVAIITALARNIAGPDVILVGGLVILMTMSLFSDRFPSPTQAVSGFGNEGLITVAVLFVVVAGLSQTGAMNLIVQPLLGRPRTVLSAQARMMFPVSILSAFLNNTPIVAMFMPVVNDWARRTGISPAKLFIPLSYAAILGGTCTLIGTSTNLVVNGMLIADPTRQGLHMFDIAWIGVPALAIGLTYILITSRWLLPDRRPAISMTDDPRQYTVEMLVEPESALDGQTIEQAGLRHLPGLFLAEIDRNGEVIAAVGPEQVLHGGDRLIFVGVVESVVDLQKIRGLVPATNQVFKLDAPRSQRQLIEAVVSDSGPLISRSIREGRFRTRYNAAVIAVARNGERVPGKIGDIVLRAGDTLLLEAHPSFADQQRNSRDFFLVSRVEGSTPPRHERAWIALAILLALVVIVGMGWISMLGGAMLAAAAMVLTRCTSGDEARRNIDWQILIVIGAALGIGRAMEMSGAASAVASQLIGLASGNPFVVLLAVYLVTTLFTELITNNAAAVLVYPIAMGAADSMGASPVPFAITIMMAASAAFSTPVGYQTNLMVYGPGGYRFTDYTRIGLPLNLLVMAVTVGITPWVFPL